jgi:acyl-CoA thioesterase-1
MHYRVLLGLLLALPGLSLAGQCSLLILGDSLSSGYGLAPKQGWVDKLGVRLTQRAPEWRAVNASVSGDTTQNGVQRLPAALQRQRPQGVLISLGGNDALRGTPPSEIRNNLLTMVRAAKRSGAWVLLFEPPVLPNYGKAYADAVARQYREVAREEGVALVPCFVCEVGVDAALMQPDGIHPNARAQGRMLDAVWPSLQPKLRCGGGKNP